MSPVKLGLAVWGPAFWSGVPFKLVIALLFLAMGVHPWEMPGLAFLLLLSIPIDIWAMGVSARTIFLERLRLSPPDSLGLTLWWQSAILNAIYLPVAYFMESGVTAGAHTVADAILSLGLMKALPVAERISINLVLWASVSAMVLIILVLVYLSLFGRIVRRQAAGAQAATESYQGLVRSWDLMRVPADQPLMLTVFTATGVLLVFGLWAFMPVTTPHPHESYKEDTGKKVPELRPVEALKKTEKLLAQAETRVEALETKAEEEAREKEQEKGKGKGKGKEAADSVKPKGEAAKAGEKPASAQPAAPKTAGK
jgi:hypothetical protein